MVVALAAFADSGFATRSGFFAFGPGNVQRDDTSGDDDDENKETTRDNLGVVGLSNGLAASFRAKIAARRAANERGAREENDGLVAAGALGRTT